MKNNTSDIIHNTSERPRFSIIIPLYNKAPYVKKALDSIAFQTCKDFELIIVDDGSTDNSLAIVKEFVDNKFEILNHKSSIENIRIISQPNAGVAAARNNGVAASTGQFLCFLDADDWWEPHFLEEMEKLIAEYPDAGIYATNYIYYKPGKTHIALKLQRGYMNYPEAYLQSVAMPIWTGAVCMPRNVFDEMGGFPVGIKLGEDFLLWAKTALHYPIAFCEKPLAYYNNNVPASLRATRNLHAPEHLMLFNLTSLEAEIEQSAFSSQQSDLWKSLLDWLRVNGLMPYWISEEYHDDAAKELEKVDWSKQPASQIRKYKTPIWILKAKKRFMQIGSYWKQKLIKLIHHT